MTTARSALGAAMLIVANLHVATAQSSVSATDTLHLAQPRVVATNKFIPAFEVAGFLVALSAYDRIAYSQQMQDGKKVYSSTLSSTWEHIRQQKWVHDQDPFNINQFAHPYQGATMYGLARSSGRGFWGSLLHANAGSLAWKMAGETDPPSIDDMVTTGQAGSLLGETLYRIAGLVIKDDANGGVHPWRNRLADVLSPPRAVNRRMLGDRYQQQVIDSAPATSWQLRLGATLDALARDRLAPVSLLRKDATAEFWMSYGLPGRPGYEYNRPLDYFDIQVSLLSSASNPIENVMIRGLLAGKKTSFGERARGIWGMYGSYDYISPYLFRVSSTAVSVGTTQQLWIAPDVALQATFLTGVGYGAAGSTTTTAATPLNEAIRDYHIGITPQALATTRFIVGDRAMFDFAAREYYVSGLGSDDVHGAEAIFRGSAGVNVRVYGGHTIGARFVQSNRDARYGSAPFKHISEGTVTIAYSFLGTNQFSAVHWAP